LKRIILCGGSGYIGTKLTEVLLEKTDYHLVIIDRLDFKLDSDFKSKYYESERVEFHQKDIRDLNFMNEQIHEGDYVVNLAALVGEPLCKIKPEEAVDVNFEAAKNLANLCKEKNIKKFIQLSTCSNYGQAKEMVDEDGELFPTSLYAETKVNLEKYLIKNISNATILRCATAYGLSVGRMRFDLLVSDFIKEAWLEKQINVFMPEVHRPIVHVSDISNAILLCIKHEGILSRVYNVGSSIQNYTKRQIAEKVSSRLDVPLNIVEKVDKRDYIVNFDRIKNELNFSTNFLAEDGIEEMVKILEDGNFDLEQSNV
jgi:nucleoside-diphosphate-sugar epimerase